MAAVASASAAPPLGAAATTSPARMASKPTPRVHTRGRSTTNDATCGPPAWLTGSLQDSRRRRRRRGRFHHQESAVRRGGGRSRGRSSSRRSRQGFRTYDRVVTLRGREHVDVDVAVEVDPKDRGSIVHRGGDLVVVPSAVHPDIETYRESANSMKGGASVWPIRGWCACV